MNRNQVIKYCVLSIMMCFLLYMGWFPILFSIGVNFLWYIVIFALCSYLFYECLPKWALSCLIIFIVLIFMFIILKFFVYPKKEFLPKIVWSTLSFYVIAVLSSFCIFFLTQKKSKVGIVNSPQKVKAQQTSIQSTALAGGSKPTLDNNPATQQQTPNNFLKWMFPASWVGSKAQKKGNQGIKPSQLQPQPPCNEEEFIKNLTEEFTDSLPKEQNTFMYSLIVGQALCLVYYIYNLVKGLGYVSVFGKIIQQREIYKNQIQYWWTNSVYEYTIEFQFKKKPIIVKYTTQSPLSIGSENDIIHLYYFPFYKYFPGESNYILDNENSHPPYVNIALNSIHIFCTWNFFLLIVLYFIFIKLRYFVLVFYILKSYHDLLEIFTKLDGLSTLRLASTLNLDHLQRSVKNQQYYLSIILYILKCLFYHETFNYHGYVEIQLFFNYQTMTNNGNKHKFVETLFDTMNKILHGQPSCFC